jgi:hypothetical protein
MAQATLQFDLANPDDEREHRYALAGRQALLALYEVNEAIRRRMKYGELSRETDAVLEELQQSLPHDLISLLD